MKKRERVKRKDNVVFFPGIEKRLTDKGIESLHNKKFNDAIYLLEEAREHDPDKEEILIGLVMAYFEAGAFQKAKVLAREILHKGIGDYFQMVDLYLTVLIQLHEYQEIITTIEALLDEKEVPPEKYDHFLTILQFSQKMTLNHNQDLVESTDSSINDQELGLFSQNNLNEQMMLISSLADKNIRPFINEIEEYLKAESGHAFLKTILLTLLKEQEIDRTITFKKFAAVQKVVPTELPEIKEQPKMLKVKAAIGNRLESTNPVLYENIMSLVERTFFISYPMELEPESAAAWAAAFHLLADDYHGIESDITELAEEYEAESEEVEQAKSQIELIEKISYPNL
ncbi:tetratricopeptide repeat protein [Neobacillus kokaensis]|uniref:TPR repeat-containing protein YsoA n=1 Tax=Neobacillus kokaensis TaxID=2759023 RepID=A0ABQ3MZA8_9BACI|nr:tetratricopeptide repeat protein [Neobacillus kokaensis]GHH97216.1 TPR repeat-containing protein YsoA [Neobacillus kokaensis]